MTQNQMAKRALLTDLYQLTMGAAYFDNNKNDVATFDLFVRKLPEDWGFYIANGIEDAIDFATNVRFDEGDLEYLREQGLFKEEYLQYLKEFRFTGDVLAVQEGTPMPPNVPILRVTAPRIEAQILETALLNTINFQTMIATKANRVVQAAGGAAVADFGLRRAQEEDAAVKGSRAAYLGGCAATSNVKAGKKFGIPITGTHAHAFVMSFPAEIDAFRAYARTFPNNPTLLIDTYDTVDGAMNAAIVGKELEEQGMRLGAVRLDSGDLADLSKKVRKVLDEAGLGYVRIVASNDLNEYKIDEIRKRGGRIDAYGVGTELITAKPVAAIPGVYKIVEDGDGAKIKLAPGKKTYPGRKQVYRQGCEEYTHDVLALEHEPCEGKPLLEQVVGNGERLLQRRALAETRAYALEQVAMMPARTKGVRALPYNVQTTEALNNLVEELQEVYV